MDGRCGIIFSFKSFTGSMNARIEVIDPATWTYISLRDVTIGQGGYVQVKPEVFVRATIGGTSSEIAYIDDLQVSCSENQIW